MKILGFDPGFAKLGWVNVDYDGTDWDFIDGGVVTTERSDKKRKILAADDNQRRLYEICDALFPLPWTDTDLVAIEAQSWPRNSSACLKIAMFWGAVGMLCRQYEIPMLQIPPKDLKKWLTGHRSATKKEVLREVCQTKGFERFVELVQGMNLADREHMSDAGGVTIVSANSDMVRAMVKTTRLQTPPKRKRART